ncbi:MAG: endonuclease [Paludibacteraceae bacterium]|nr:endonuclease [Paludibacteraceae bacterium]
MKRIIIILSCVFAYSSISAQNYYQAAENKSDSELKTALHNIISANSVRYTFGSGAHHTWEGFYYTDRKEDNSVWDMYSDEIRYFGAPFASIPGIDIEHTFPKSWWGGSVNDGYKDLHLLTPADYSANRSKSNNAMGIVSEASFDNGSFKVGKNPDYGDFKIFEPADEYKGDFARIFFYVATCYQDYAWVLDNTRYGSYYALTNNYLTFQPWEIEVLLNWHRQDPVSEKEINRHEEVYKIQGNRNPFIDYPCLAELIWGNKKGTALNTNNILSTSDIKYLAMNDKSGCTCEITQPTLVRPLNNSTIHFNELSRNETQTISLPILTAQLTDNITLSIEGTDASAFTLSTNNIEAYSTNIGTSIDLSFCPKTLGEHKAQLHLKSNEIDAIVELEGLCTTVFHAFQPTNISGNGFTANWSDAEVANYSLDVYQYPLLCKDSIVLDLNPITIANINAQYKENFDITGSVITYQSMLKLGSLDRHGDFTISSFDLREDNLLEFSVTQYDRRDSLGSLVVIVNQDTLATYRVDTTLAEYSLELPNNVESIKFAQGDTTKRLSIGYLRLQTCHRTPQRQSLEGYPIEVAGTSHYVDYIIDNDTVYYRITPQGGHESEEIAVWKGITDNVESQEYDRIKYITEEGNLHLYELEPNSEIRLYNNLGQLIGHYTNTAEEFVIPVQCKGIILVQISNQQRSRTLKIVM